MYDAKRVYVIGRAPDDHAEVVGLSPKGSKAKADTSGFVVIGNA